MKKASTGFGFIPAHSYRLKPSTEFRLAFGVCVDVKWRAVWFFFVPLPRKRHCGSKTELELEL